MRSVGLWAVISPEYGVVVPVLGFGLGPTEYGCDYVEVEASSRREAIVKGVREMRRHITTGQSEEKKTRSGG